ncbi:MAG: protease modulator HflC [Rhodospirillales bacterium]|jgi:membrane protease subunit HflC|tara:strand:+ start:2581 stop:3453 length:873 start_codon:yes stop_codon:yes gene_type:complete
MKKSLAILGVLLAIVAIVAFNSMFTVHQAAQALILQLGNPVRVVQKPGLHFKTPFIQNVELYDRRILDLDPPPQEIILSDQKRVIVDAFARYKIVDPLEFRKKALTDANFRQLFGSRLNAAVRSQIGKILLGDMLTAKRQEVMQAITDQMKAQAAEFGTEVVDVRIGRTDLPDTTAQAVFNRMRSDRVAHAAKLRANGEKEKAEIQARADKERTIIISEAKKTSEILRGQGDGLRTTILNEAYGQDSEFFDFYRSMEAFGNSIKPGTSMVLSPQSQLFQFFNLVPKPVGQ